MLDEHCQNNICNVPPSKLTKLIPLDPKLIHYKVMVRDNRRFCTVQSKKCSRCVFSFPILTEFM